MSKFKVGDRVRVTDESGSAAYKVGEEGIVASVTATTVLNHTQLIEMEGKNGSAMFGERFEPVAVAPATATLTVEAGKFYKTRDGRKVGPMGRYGAGGWQTESREKPFGGYLWDNDGGRWFACDRGGPTDLVAEWVDEPVVVTVEAGKSYEDSEGNVIGPMFVLQPGFFAAVRGNGQSWKSDGSVYGSANGPSPLIREYKASEPAAVAPAIAAPEIEIEVAIEPAPAVGSPVLIPGWITAINTSRKGTVYSIAFETKNRRVGLHFREDDFILDTDEDDGCPCSATNDNGPAPGTDTAKAFDALGDWLRALAVNPSAAFRSSKEAA